MTSAWWQATQCNPARQMSFYSGEAVCKFLYTLLTYFTYLQVTLKHPTFIRLNNSVEMNRSQYILAHTIRSKVDITFDENFHKDFLKTVAALAREMQSFSILLRGLLDIGFCS